MPPFADSDCSLELIGRVTLYTDELLSIVFEGQTYSRDAAYPLSLMFTMNLNPKTGEYIRFSDRYVVDKPLYDAVAARATELLTEASGGEWPEGWGTFAEQIEAAQSDQIDGVTMATITTGAIKRALRDALLQAVK